MSHLEIIDQESVRIAMEYYLCVTTTYVKTTYPVNPQTKWYLRPRLLAVHQYESRYP